MDIVELFEVIGNFKKMNLPELECTLTNMYEYEKQQQKKYSEISRQIDFIIRELHEEIEKKLPIETDSDDDLEINDGDIKLVDVCSDEE
jgi:iron-sulfur cluster repair protein YtfE (RIC family)